MRRTAMVLSVTLAVSIAAGVLGDRLLSAQQSPIKRTELLKTDVAGMEGKEAIVYIAELGPGAAAGKHFHPGPEFAYVLDGALTLDVQGPAPKTFKTGEAFTQPVQSGTRREESKRNCAGQGSRGVDWREGPTPGDPCPIAESSCTHRLGDTRWYPPFTSATPNDHQTSGSG